jgi:hypothetical protein
MDLELFYQGRGNHDFFLEVSILLVSIAAFAQALITLGAPAAQAAQAAQSRSSSLYHEPIM